MKFLLDAQRYVSATLRLVCALALAGLASTLATTTAVRADQKQMADFFAAQGCAIGPSTIAAARAKGFEASAIDEYAAAARANPKTTKTAEWLVLPREVCEIKPPAVTSEIRITDPEVVQSLSAIDAYAKDGDIGCYLSPDQLMAAVKLSRKWDDEKANLEYLRFLAASIVAGDLSFYSPDPLRTPPGFVATSGPCAAIPQLAKIKRSQELLMKNFDALIRADAAGEAVCNSGVPSWKFPEIMERIAGEKPANAWMFFELSLIAMGAGWYDGMTGTQKGEPRPPLCRYG